MRLIVLLIFVLGPSSEAAITLEEAPRLGHETWLTITRDEAPTGGETVTVVHRPGIVGEEEIAIGITDARGRVRWTPRIGTCYRHSLVLHPYPRRHGL
jgi:hypothetical protein